MGRTAKKKQRQLLLKKARNFSVLLMLQVAVLLGVGYGYFWSPPRQQPLRVLPASTLAAQTPTEPPKQKNISGKPVHIQIPKLGIELQILDGVYNQQDNSWTLSDRLPHFALPSVPANNQAGSTLIYGHNNKYVFGSLNKLSVGDIAYVQTDNGHIFSYVYQTVQKVGPTDTSILAYQGPPILTLQTCTGLWNEWRQMFYFKLQTVTTPDVQETAQESFASWLSQQLRLQPVHPTLKF